MKIPYLDLMRQYKTIQTEVDSVIERVIKKQSFILGEELAKFEQEFARYLKVNYAVGVGSGTDALILALRSLEIGPGDELITPVNSYISTTLAITEVGATPVFVDVDPDTYQTSVEQVGKKITKKTRAILPVHLYGAACQIDDLVEVAADNNLYLFEDACQAHGSTFNGKKTGTFGDVGVFSFYPAKNLGCYGDGGAVVTNNKKIYERIVRLRNYGQSKKNIHEIPGINSRLDEIQAAVLRVKLNYLDQWNKRRRILVKTYKKYLEGFKFQKISKSCIPNYYVFSIEIDNRENAIKRLHDKGIETHIHYPTPIHLQPCYQYLGYKVGDFPVAEGIAKCILSLPIYPELEQKEILFIAANLNMEK